MQEKLLQFIWKNGLFDKTALTDCNGQEISIQHPGYLNTDAGPDFLQAKIKIGATRWAGNVEIHVNGIDWMNHNHHLDPAYNNVILHVCLNQAELAIAQDKHKIPALNLANRINPNLIQKYEYMMAAQQDFPCQNLIGSTSTLDWISQLDALLVERLAERVEKIQHDVEKANTDWDELLYRYLAAALGQKVNALPMKILAEQVPYKLIQKHSQNPLQIEALLFGTAGLLSNQHKSPYALLLKKEFDFLSHKYGLVPMDASLWKFMRLRPAAFPTLRIAQLAAILNNKRGLFRTLIEEEQLDPLYVMLQAFPSDFWHKHYTFEKSTNNKQPAVGKSTLQSLFINALIPVLFTYGKNRNNQWLCDKAIDWLAALPAEDNKIIRKFNLPPIPCENAQHAQAILQLHNNYCIFKRCLDCGIGKKLLEKTK